MLLTVALALHGVARRAPPTFTNVPEFAPVDASNMNGEYGEL